MSFLRHLLPGWKRVLNDNSANAAILQAIDRELTEVESDTITGKVVMSLEQATGTWLNQYGDIFGVIRKDNESDEDYRNRIKTYVNLKRGTIPAIKDAIRGFLQDYSSYIEIYEPYNNVFILNKSKLNSKDGLLGEYYKVAVIDITFTNTFPVSIISTINDFKPAGVKVLLTKKPKEHNDKAPVFKIKTTSSIVQKAIEIQENRNRAYLSLENSGIIGYKRVYKFFLVRPLSSTEDINNPPYPVLLYGNKPWVMIPKDKAVAENAHHVLITARLEDKDFSNKAYNKVSLHMELIPKNNQSKDTLTKEEVIKVGPVLLSETRDLQERGENITILEQFMIEVIN